MKHTITKTNAIRYWKCILVIALALELSFSDQLFAQCSGFFLTVDTDPPYLNYCPGDTVTAFPIITGGTSPFTYLWSTGGTDSLEILTALDNGWYNACVTVTDANGCVAYGCKHIKPTFWNLNIYASAAQCEGQSVDLYVSVGPPDNTFLWSTGDTTSSISVFEPGVYTVTVTETEYGCTQVLTVEPEFYPAPNPEVNGPAQICNGQTATLEVIDGSDYYSFSWDPSGEASSSIEIGEAGTFTVTVSDNTGCTGTAEIIVEPLLGTLPDLGAPTQLCAEDVGTVEVTNTEDFDSFIWNTGETTASINGVANETYVVTVTDSNGCEESAEISIALFDVVDPIILGDNEICVNQESDTLIVSQSFSNYLWSTGETTQQIIVTVPELYTVTVTDANGCTSTGEHGLIAAPIPEPNIQVPPVSCDNLPALLWVSGNGGPYVSFLWLPTGETDSEIVVEESGTYSVEVTNAYGCTASAYEVIIYVGYGPTADIAAMSVGCNGAWTLMASGGTDYMWSTGETTQSIITANNGTFTVTVSDDYGCTDTAVEQVTISNELQVEIFGPTEMCDGDTTILNVSSGFDEYLWTDGETVNEISITQPGTYTITVTDANGCTGTDSITIAGSSLPEPEILGAPGFCAGDSTVLMLSEDFAAIAWSNGAMTQSISVTESNTYSVVVTNINGCTATDDWTIAEFTAPDVDIIGPASICTGSSATLTVSGSYNDIIWSTGETTQSIVISGNGTFEVVVTDSSGCTASDLHEVVTSNSLSPEITITTPPCADTVELDTDTGYATYLWSNDSTTSGIIVTTAGTYSVTVSDTTGCVGESELIVSMPEMPQLNISGPTSACKGDPVILDASPGFISYIWSTGDTSRSISASTPGIYIVEVTDVNGCGALDSLSLEWFPDPVVDILGPSSICTGSSSTLTVSGTYSEILWSTGETTPSIVISGDGTYEVVVTDNSGCKATDQHRVETGDSLSPAITISGPICEGMARLDAGAGYDTYLWSNGSTTSLIEVTISGSYSVTVTDQSGCSGDDIVNVVIPMPPQVNIAGPNAICEGTTGTLIASPGYSSYDWSTGDVTESISVFESGFYMVTVTDSNGCTDSAGQSFELLLLPDVQITGPGPICSGDIATLQVSGNFAKVLWSTGEEVTSISVSQSGNYSVLVTDENGCTATSEYMVMHLQTDFTYVHAEACSALDTGIVEILMVNRFGCDSIVTVHTDIAPSMNTDIFLDVCVGENVIFDDITIAAGTSQQITYMAGNGCDSIVTVTVVELPAAQFDLDVTPTCPNAIDGAIEVIMQSGTAPFQIAINGSEPQMVSVFPNLPIGIYSVSVIDALGCVFEEEIEIPEIITVEVKFLNEELSCESNTVVLKPSIVSGDDSEVTWLWDDGSTRPWFLVEEPGEYTVNIDDGCLVQEFTTIVDWSPELQSGNTFYIPNTFSPNNDGTNDLLQVFSGPDHTILNFEFKIFDRWGTMLFGTSYLEEGWNGSFKGQQMEPGVYVWYIKAKVELCGLREIDVIKKGDVTIIR